MTGQQTFLRTRIAQLNKKNRIIDSADSFVQQAKRFGLTKNRWDRFQVNLSDEALTFEQFQTIIEQTANSAYYYFTPETLQARVIKKNSGVKPGDQALQPTYVEKNTDLKGLEAFDLIVTLNGSFLIRN